METPNAREYHSCFYCSEEGSHLVTVRELYHMIVYLCDWHFMEHLSRF